MVDFSSLRQTMIERQLRPNGVLSDTILAAFAHTPREIFVPDTHQAVAYADMALPLNHGQQMLKPSVQGQLLQALQVQAGEHVLEVGTGSGFLTAVLAKLAHRVTSVEIFEDILLQAQQHLVSSGCHNVQLQCADYAQGPTPVATYEAIVITGALVALPPSFYQALKPGGRIVAILGSAAPQRACLIQKVADIWQTQSLFECSTPYLVNASSPDPFHF